MYNYNLMLKSDMSLLNKHCSVLFACLTFHSCEPVIRQKAQTTSKSSDFSKPPLQLICISPNHQPLHNAAIRRNQSPFLSLTPPSSSIDLTALHPMDTADDHRSASHESSTSRASPSTSTFPRLRAAIAARQLVLTHTVAGFLS